MAGLECALGGRVVVVVVVVVVVEGEGVGEGFISSMVVCVCVAESREAFGLQFGYCCSVLWIQWLLL
jgi:hypothetical protein